MNQYFECLICLFESFKIRLNGNSIRKENMKLSPANDKLSSKHRTVSEFKYLFVKNNFALHTSSMNKNTKYRMCNYYLIKTVYYFCWQRKMETWRIANDVSLHWKHWHCQFYWTELGLLILSRLPYTFHTCEHFKCWFDASIFLFGRFFLHFFSQTMMSKKNRKIMEKKALIIVVINVTLFSYFKINSRQMQMALVFQIKMLKTKLHLHINLIIIRQLL